MRPIESLLLQNRFTNWLFRDRETNEITIVQKPNIFLWLYIAVVLIRIIARPTGLLRTVTSTAGALIIFVWAILEVLRGVSPFRRMLGGVVLIAEIASLVTR